MLKIGFVYDQIDELPETVSGAPVTAEYEDAATLDWFRSTLGRWGDVIDLPLKKPLPLSDQDARGVNTPEAAEACSRLANAGIPLGNQSVLLRDINDTPETMRKLVRGLLEMRLRPYYIYQAQTLSGTAHFRTPVERGIEIIKSFRGFISRLAVPTYLLDTPYGKIPMHPETILRRDNDAVCLQTWDGNVHREPNPGERNQMNREQPLPS